MRSLPKYFRSNGFTLIEILVVVTMLSVIVLIALFVLNPFSQMDKAKDAGKKHDLEQIRNALDAYYNDTGCYPTSIPFGAEWKLGDQILMKEVPQDLSPTCDRLGCYYYVYSTDKDSNCPQWNILFARMKKLEDEDKCINQIMKKLKSQCPQTQINAKYDFCLLSGNIDCDAMADAYPSPYTIETTTTTSTTTTTTAPTTTTTTSPVYGDCLCSEASYRWGAAAPYNCQSLDLGEAATYCTNPENYSDPQKTCYCSYSGNQCLGMCRPE